MLAGDPNRRTLDVNDPAQDAVGYTCLGTADLTRKHGMPIFDHLVLTAQNFPPRVVPTACALSCTFRIAGMALTYTDAKADVRDGIHSWLEGSKHVVYGEGKYDAQGAKCPPSHPKRIMSLLYEFAFTVSSLPLRVQY